MSNAPQPEAREAKVSKGPGLRLLVGIVAGIAFGAAGMSVIHAFTAADAPAQAEAPAWCATSTDDRVVVGNGPGDITTGPGLIKAFDYAYYVERDAAKVSSMYVTAQPLAPLQEAIDAVPAGTEHCLTITPTADASEFDVRLRLRTADGAESVSGQLVTVANVSTGLKINRLQEAPQ